MYLKANINIKQLHKHIIIMVKLFQCVYILVLIVFAACTSSIFISVRVLWYSLWLYVHHLTSTGKKQQQLKFLLGGKNILLYRLEQSCNMFYILYSEPVDPFNVWSLHHWPERHHVKCWLLFFFSNRATAVFGLWSFFFFFGIWSAVMETLPLYQEFSEATNKNSLWCLIMGTNLSVRACVCSEMEIEQRYYYKGCGVAETLTVTGRSVFMEQWTNCANKLKCAKTTSVCWCRRYTSVRGNIYLYIKYISTYTLNTFKTSICLFKLKIYTFPWIHTQQ